MKPFRRAIRTLIFVFVGLVLGLGIYCYGQNNTQNNTESAPSQEPAHKMMTGTVNEVRPVFKILRITGEQGLVSIQVPSEAQITKGTRTIHLDDINTGDSVVVTYYSPEPGKFIAVTILDSTMDSG